MGTRRKPALLVTPEHHGHPSRLVVRPVLPLGVPAVPRNSRNGATDRIHADLPTTRKRRNTAVQGRRGATALRVGAIAIRNAVANLRGLRCAATLWTGGTKERRSVPPSVARSLPMSNCPQWTQDRQKCYRIRKAGAMTSTAHSAPGARHQPHATRPSAGERRLG
jgi:hypothetical protein